MSSLIASKGRYQHIAVMDTETSSAGGTVIVPPNGANLLLIGGAHLDQDAPANTILRTERVVTSNPGSSGYIGQITDFYPPAATMADSLKDPLTAVAYDVVVDTYQETSKTGYVLAFGGVDFSGTATRKLHSMLIKTKNWTTVSTFLPGSEVPAERAYAAAAYMQDCYLDDTVQSGKCFAVFGGINENGQILGSIDVLRIFGTSAAPTFSWNTPKTSNVGPSPRYDHSMTMHFDSSSAFVFGGVATEAGNVATGAAGSCSQTVSNELWQLSPAGYKDATVAEMTNVINNDGFESSVSRIFPVVPDPLWSGPPSTLIDGVALDGIANVATVLEQTTDSFYNRCFFTTRGGVTQPFVEIDLGRNTFFTMVSLFAQTDCFTFAQLTQQQDCISRMQNFEVWSAPTNISFGTANAPWESIPTAVKCDQPVNDKFVAGQQVISCSKVPTTGHRYVWISLPGATRVIGLCEVEVLRPSRWAWRQLSGGLFNAALGKQASQSSIASIIDGVFRDAANAATSFPQFAEASRAIDGITTNDARSQSCAITDCNGDDPCVTVVPGAFQEWRVNLQTPTAVKYLKIWPAVFDGQIGPKHGGPIILPNRTREWVVSVGMSSEPELNTQCTGGPIDFSPSELAEDGSLTVPCATNALFVIIRKYSGGYEAGGTNNDGDDAVSVCEVQVWAELALNTPSPRAGHAAAGFRGHLMIWGGYDSSGSLLNDLHMFRMPFKGQGRGSWTVFNRPLGTLPGGRSYARITPLGNNFMAISGGLSGSKPTSEVFTLNWKSCPLPVITGVQNPVYCRQGGVICQYTCAANYISNNVASDGWLACNPNGGFSGVNPPCSASVPSEPQNVRVLSTASNKALVAWDPPSNLGGLGTSKIEYYYVYTSEEAGGAEWFDVFDGGEAKFNANYKFVDPTANATAYFPGNRAGSNRYSVDAENLRLQVTPAMDCFTRTINGVPNCPFIFYNTWPSSLQLNNVVFQTSIRLSGDNLNIPGVLSGLSLVDVKTGLLQFVVGIEFVAPFYYAVWQSFIGGSPGRWRILEKLSFPNVDSGVQLQVKMEISSQTSTGAPAIEAFYKVRSPDLWTSLGRPAGITDLVAPTGNPTYYIIDNSRLLDMRATLVVRNYQTLAAAANGRFSLFEAEFDFLRVSRPQCNSPGESQIVPGTASSVEIKGLTPGASYKFEVAASNDVNALAWGYWGPPGLQSAVSNLPVKNVAVPDVSTLVMVPKNKRTYLRPYEMAGSRADMAFDDQYATNLYNINGAMQCATSYKILASDVTEDPSILNNPIMWIVDLEQITYVKAITVFIAGDQNPVSFDGFRVLFTDDEIPVNYDSFTTGQTCLEYGAKPYSLNREGYNATFACEASGRFMALVVKAQVNTQISICEVSVYTENNCPARPSTQSVISLSSDCGTLGGLANYGAYCEQTCAPGYVQAKGAPNATCIGNAWSEPQLFCEPTCPELAAPEFTADCFSSYFYEDFNGNAATLKSRWYSADRRQGWDTTWFYNPNNYIVEAAARRGCNEEMLLINSQFIDYNIESSFIYETVWQSRDAAGMAYRIVDGRNYYRMVSNPRGKTISIEKVVDGTPFTLATRRMSRLDETTYYRFILYVDGPEMNVTMARWEGDGSALEQQQVLTARDSTFTAGGAGLFVQTWAKYQLAHLYGRCYEKKACGYGVANDECAFFCADGFDIRGSQVRRCIVNTTDLTSYWSGTPLTCAHPFPIFRTAAVACSRNLKEGDQCGEEPMQAYTLVPDSEIWYNIVAGNADINGSPVFYVDECSGTIRIRNATSLREENIPGGQKVYTLTIRARVRRDNADFIQDGFPLASQTVVRVVIEDAVDTPIVPAVQTMYINENTPPKTLVGRVQAFDINPAIRIEQAGFILEGGLFHANKYFTIDYNTGDLYTAAAPKDPYTAPHDFDYETDPTGVLTLYVRVERVWNPEFFKTGTVLIDIRDMNDPPLTGEPYYAFNTADLKLGTGSGAAPVNLDQGNIYDEDIYEDAFNSFKGGALTLAPPQFDIVKPSLWATLPLYNPCQRFNVPSGGKLATQDGSVSGPDIFEVLPGNQLAIKTNVLIPTDTPLAVAGTGVLADDIFYVCISGTDTSPSPPLLKSYQLIPVIAKADESSLNIIQSCQISGALTYLSTKGNQLIDCIYSGVNPTAITATYKSAGSTLTFSALGCYFTPAAPGTGTIQCTTAPGVGVNLVWSFFNLGIGIAVKVPFETSYQPPIVTSVNYTSLWPCTTCRPSTVGGDIITIIGTNFGASSIKETDGSPAVNVLFIQNVVLGQRTPPAAPYLCAYLEARSSDTAVSCVVPPGAGTQMTIRVEVGNTYALQNLGYRYTVPVIRSITLDSPTTNSTDNLETEGGQFIKITGSNFGPGKTEQQNVYVTFGGTDGRLQSFLDCTNDVVDPHSIIRCKTLPSQGADLRILVTVGSQSSAVTSGVTANFLGISYKRAVITNVYGPGVTSASTRGGQIIYVEGDNFPPITLGGRTLQRILLSYGPGIDRRFTATQCVVIKELPARPTMQCLSAPGTGKMDSFVLAIDLVPSVPYVPTLPCSYEAPVVIGISGLGVSNGQTSGNSPIVITGSGFGPLTAYTNAALSVFYGLQNRGANTSDASLRPINFRAQACTITIAHQQITCLSAPGVGAGLTLSVTVNGLASTSNTLRYEEPMITGVYYYPTSFVYPNGMWLNEALWPTSSLTSDPILGDPNNFYALVVRGVNFGPATITSFVDGSTTLLAPPYDPICDTCITFGPTGTENNVYNPVLFPSKWHQSTTQVILAVGQGAGGIGKLRIRIQSGNQFSAVNLNATFQFSPPVWKQVEPKTANPNSITSNGNTIVTLRATNIPFLDQTAKLVVNFGQSPFTQTIIPADLPSTANQLASIRNVEDGSYNISFELPNYFGGRNIPITISQVRSVNNIVSTNLVLDADPSFAFNYNPPEIEDIIMKKYPASDLGKDLCRDSNNFGPQFFPVVPNPAIPSFTCSPTGPIRTGQLDIYKITILGKNFLPRQSELCPPKKFNPLTQAAVPCNIILPANGVSTYVEILNRVNVTNTSTTFKWLPAIGDAVILGGPVTAALVECPYNQAGLRRLNPLDVNFSFSPSYACTYQASLNTYRFLEGWSDSKIEIFTTAAEGEVRVRHVSNNFFRSRLPGKVVCNAGVQSQFLGETCQETVISSTFSAVNPTIDELQGITTDIPTTGALPTDFIRLSVPDLYNTTNMTILIGNGDVLNGMPRTVCPLVKVGPAPTYAYQGLVVNQLVDIVQAQLARGLDRGVFWTIGCIPPRGQGLNQPVTISRTLTNGITQTSFDQQNTVSYAQPEITSFISSETAIVPIALRISSFPRYTTIPTGSGFTTTPSVRGVTRPNAIGSYTTATSRMFIVGKNLGIRPAVVFGARSNTVITALTECTAFTGVQTATNAPGAQGPNTHTCYYFAGGVAGEGDGLETGFIPTFPKGFTLKFIAGNSILSSLQDDELTASISTYQSSPLFNLFKAEGGGGRSVFPYEFPFTYLPPVVTAVTTNFGVAPEISTAGNLSLVVTLSGYNFGATNVGGVVTNFTAWLGYKNAKTGVVTAWSQCRTPACTFTRISHTGVRITGMPPGGGKNLEVKIQIGSVEGISSTNISYSAPVIEEAYSIVFEPNPCPGYDLPAEAQSLVKTCVNFTVLVNSTYAKSANSSLNEWIPINATLFAQNPKLVPAFPCPGDDSNEFSQRLRGYYCTGEGYDKDSMTWKTQTWACSSTSALPTLPAKLVFRGTNASTDLRYQASSTLVNVLTRQPLLYSSWVSRCPSSGTTINITNINGGVYNPVSKTWKSIPFDTSVASTNPLTLTGPSRVVKGKTLGSTSGTTMIVLKGRNFGPGIFKGDTYSCPMLSWTNRVSGTEPLKYKGITSLDCNSREDFLGEGELPRANILEWDDVNGIIVFIPGPGIGIKDVEVVAFGQSRETLANTATERVFFRYDAPIAVPKLMFPPKLPGAGFRTDGLGQVPKSLTEAIPVDARLPSFSYLNIPAISGTLAQHAFISFNGCCESQSECESASNWLGVLPKPCLATNQPFDTKPYTDVGFLSDAELVYKLPTAIFIFVFSNAEDDFAMVTDFRNVDGTAHPSLIAACNQFKIPKENCITERIDRFSRSTAHTFSFVPPMGVGNNINVDLQVWDGTTQVWGKRAVHSNKYLEPFITSVPNLVLLGDSSEETFITFRGEHFGTDSITLPPRMIDDTSKNSLNPRDLIAYIGSTGTVNTPTGAFGTGYACFASKRIQTNDSTCFGNVIFKSNYLLDTRSLGSLSVPPDVENIPLDLESCVDVDIECKVNPLNAKVGYEQPFVRVANQLSLTQRDSFRKTPFPKMIIGCKAGYFAGLGGSCLPCPYEGAVCRGYDSSRDSKYQTDPLADPFFAARFYPPAPKMGWFDMNSTYTNSPLYRPGYSPSCPDSVRVHVIGSKAFRDVCIIPCPNYYACVDENDKSYDPLSQNMCATGYRSVAPYWRCAVCDFGYFMKSGVCQKCKDDATLAFLMIGYIGLILFAIIAAWLLSKYEVHVALFSIGFDFMQTVSMLGTSKVVWGESVNSLFWVLSASYLDIEIIQPECYSYTKLPGYSPTQLLVDKFYAVLWLPVAIVFGLACIHFGISAFNTIVKKQRFAIIGRHAPALVSCSILVVSLLYMYETENLLQVFNCSPSVPPVYHEMYPGTDSTNTTARALALVEMSKDWRWQRLNVVKYMHTIPEECVNYWGFKGTQLDLLPWAMTWMVVGVAGWPIGIAIWLRINRMTIMEDQLLRAKGTGNDRLTGPETFDFRRTWGRLYYQFRPDCWYWQVVIYLRKLIFLIVMLYSWNQNGGYQMVGCSIVLLCFYVLHVRIAPFMGPDTYEEVLRDHQNKSMTSILHARLRTSIQGVETKGLRNNRKNVVQYDGSVNRSAILGFVLTSLFDYNTVEAILLFVNIMICNLGILTELHSAFYNDAPDAASSGIVFLVTVSLIYYFSVAIWDAILAAAAKSQANLELKKRRSSKSMRSMRKAAAGEEDEPQFASSTPMKQKVGLFNDFSRQLVDRITSSDAKSTLASMRKLAEQQDTGPVEVSINPLMAAGGSKRNLKANMDVESNEKMPAMPSMPPPPEAAIGGFSNMPVVNIAPGDLQAMAQALQQFPNGPPPEMWSSFRSAFDDAIGLTFAKDREISDLKQLMAEKDAMVRELQSLQSQQPQLSSPLSFGSSFRASASPEPSTAFSGTNQALARQASQASMRQFATAQQKALKPQKRNSYAPTTSE
jgi:hypothetical protein